MADDWGLLDKDGDAEPHCPECEADLEWIDCEGCGGEGDVDAYELDPMWYDEGDAVDCTQCAGVGGWYVCTNPQCHVVEVSP